MYGSGAGACGPSLRGKGRGKCERTLLPSLSRAHSLGRNVRAWDSPPLLIPQLSLDPLRSPPSFPQAQTESAGPGERQKSGTGGAGTTGLGAKGSECSEAAPGRGRTFSHTLSADSCTPRAFPSLCIDPRGGITGGELRVASDGPITAPGASSLPTPRDQGPRPRCPISAPCDSTVPRGTEGGEPEER